MTWHERLRELNACQEAIDLRVKMCIETTEGWCTGKASIDDVRRAHQAIAADQAAAAAHAAALSESADIVRQHITPTEETIKCH